jgi:hypothetical protein
MRAIYLIFILFFAQTASAQKIDSIFFNLYTDSLKKGYFNYINVDGKLSDGSWMPLDTSHVTLSANTGYFLGNDLFIDSSYTGEKVKVKTTLKTNPKITKEVIIYIRKRGFDEALKRPEDLF